MPAATVAASYDAAPEVALDEPPAGRSWPAEPTPEPMPAVLAVAPQSEPVAVPAPAVVAAPAYAVAPAPAATAFVLETDALQAVAEGAGLQWVNSDAEKIRAAQEAMAQEAKPVHVPREPKPVATLDDGPLVLVETRRDLSQVKLPFEAQDSTPPTT